MAGPFLFAFCFEANGKKTIKSSLSHAYQGAGKPFSRRLYRPCCCDSGEYCVLFLAAWKNLSVKF
jgi:hypothetical protein